MTTARQNIASIFLVLLMVSCVQPFETESIQFEKVVVVDGTLTNEAMRHQISLGYTTPIDTSYKSALSGATVWIEDGNGAVEMLAEEDNGIYVTSDSYSGISGQSYQLSFITSDGKEYRSEMSLLTASPPIDSIYDKYVEIQDKDINSTDQGIQFFIDSHDDSRSASFFRYEWFDTYQIVPDFPSRFAFDKTDSTITLRTDENDIATCYRNRRSAELILGTSISSALNRASAIPVNFVSRRLPVLRVRYSIEVTQYAISEAAYNFYSKIKESTESTGSLFDSQQGAIVGNVHNVKDESEPVLGFFEVAGVSKKRAFFKAREFDRRFAEPDNVYFCDPDEIFTVFDPLIFGEDTLTLYVFLNRDLDSTYVLNENYYLIDYNPAENFWSIAPQRCTTCDWFASTEQPDFWPVKFF